MRGRATCEAAPRVDHLSSSDGVPRAARKLLAKGTAAAGTIVGIRASSRGTEPQTDRWEYAVRVGSSVLGVRQQLVPERERAHLGSSVLVRDDGAGRAVIDWTASMAAGGVGPVAPSAVDWSTVEAPAEGSIDDRRRPDLRARLEGRPLVELELVAATRSTALGGALAAWDLMLRSSAGTAVLAATGVPDYAVHLLVAGATLHGIVDDAGSVLVDWEHSAMRRAEDGRPAGFDFDAGLPAVAPPDDTIEDLDAWMAEFEQVKRR